MDLADYKVALTRRLLGFERGHMFVLSPKGSKTSEGAAGAVCAWCYAIYDEDSSRGFGVSCWVSMDGEAVSAEVHGDPGNRRPWLTEAAQRGSEELANWWNSVKDDPEKWTIQKT